MIVSYLEIDSCNTKSTQKLPKNSKLTTKESITINRHDEELCQKLCEQARNQDEVNILNQLFGICSSHNETANKLEKEGLDSTYWLPILKKALSITSSSSFVHVGEDDFQKLSQYINKPWEARALRKLFNLPSEEETLQTAREKQVKDIEQKQQKFGEAIEKLKQYASEGKARHDTVVKEQEETVRKLLDVPEENWISNDETLQNMVSTVENKLISVVSSVDHVSRVEISDVELLKQSSGGLALQGVYVTNGGNEFAFANENLMEVPCQFSLNMPCLPQKLETSHFSSEQKEATFEKNVSKLGLYNGTSLSVSTLSFGVKAAVSVSHSSVSESDHKSQCDQAYVCTTKSCFVPMASCNIPLKKMCLTSHVLRDLKYIERIRDEKLALQKCDKLFQNYGSHASKGPIHFGGIYTWKSAIKGFRKTSKANAEHLSTEALDIHASASYGLINNITGATDVSALRYKGQYTGRYSDSLMSMGQLSITKNGGPQNCDEILKWRTGLIMDKSTWSVIDKGEDYVPVWDIILNHKAKFVNVYKVRKLLMKSFSQRSGHFVGDMYLLEEKNIVVSEVIKIVKDWNTDNIEEKLNKLVQWKSELMVNNDSKWWIEVVKSKPLLEFCVKVIFITHRDDTSATFNRILLKSLIGNELSFVVECEEKTRILRYLYDLDTVASEKENPVGIVTFEEMEQTLESCHKMLLMEDNSLSCRVKVKKQIMLAINCLVDSLRERQEAILEMFLVESFRLLGYHKSDQVVYGHIQPIKLKMIKNIFNINYPKLCEFLRESREKAEAFVLCIVVKSVQDTDSIVEISEERKTNYIIEMRQWVHCFQTYVKDLLVTYPKGYLNCDEFLQHLDDIVMGRRTKLALNLEGVEDNLGNIIGNKYEKDSKSLVYQRTASSDKSSILDSLRKRLGLPARSLVMEDALTVDLSCDIDTSPMEEATLIPYLLKKIMKLDYRAAHYYIKHQILYFEKDNLKEDPWDDSPSDTHQEKEQENYSQTNAIHPVDVLLTFIMSSDMMLQQYIFTKLAMCQLAVPIILLNPDTKRMKFMQWALRMVKKSWKTLDVSSESAKCFDGFISMVPSHIVSFVKIGTPPLSKSSTMNFLLNNQDHNIFYHRGCEGSQKERILLDGIVEMSWYVPSGGKKDKFTDVVTMLNLRGNVESHLAQLKFLAVVSSVIVVVSSQQEIKNASSEVRSVIKQFRDGGSKVISVFTDRAGPSKGDQVFAKGCPEATVAALLHENLLVNLKQFKEMSQLSNMKFSVEMMASQAKKCGLSIDEETDVCTKAKEIVQHITSHMDRKSVAKFKMEALSLQGAMWKNWCDLEKKLFRIDCHGNETLAERESKLRCEMQNIRKRQLAKTKEMHPFMRLYIETLCRDSQSRLFFIKWLAFHLNYKSQEELPELHQMYHTIWQEDISSNQDKQWAKHQKIQKLQDMDKKISECSLGVEHIMRELGQIYSAVCDTNIDIPNCMTLPEVAADMLIEGHPIELMDGDVAHVPLTWISAVLRKASEKLHDPRVFVLSVLGNQSTGKSTMLNTMFGLEFLVSAGRCTKGAFMQMLPVKNSAFKNAYDYVLVIDTEGLSSSEVASKSIKQHDNELATFVIGIGDMTLINIFGENPADIEDTLQITVQAFLRMSQVNLKPRCFFVHQNVGAVDSSEKSLTTRRHLQKRLDKMTAVAAEHCGVDKSISFNDVIEFNINKDVTHISGLWKGEPPMAPPNPGYNERIEDLQNQILHRVRRGFMTLSSFNAKLKDLWTALLHENFVFSFRNALEMAVYGRLEKEFGKWKWELHNFRLMKERDTLTSIKNKEDVTRAMLSQVEADIEREMKCKTEKIFEQINEFFENDDDKETLSQWKHNTKTRFEYLSNNLIAQLKVTCRECIERKQARAHLDSRKFLYEQKLLTKAKHLATNLQQRSLSERQISQEFNKIWCEIVDSLPEGHGNTVDVWIDAENVLTDTFANQFNKALRDKLSEEPLKDCGTFLFEPKKHVKYFFHAKDSEKKVVRQVVEDMKDYLSKFIQEKQCEGNDYNQSYYMSIMHEMHAKINELESSQKVSVKPEFRIDLALYLFHTAANVFEMIHAKYEYQTSPKAYLNSKKSEYLEAFQKFYHGAKAGSVVADLFVRSLKTSIESTVKQDIGRRIAGEMKANVAAFNGNRAKLESFILIDLAERENFADYAMYIQKSSQYFEKFIQTRINDYCFNTGLGGRPYVHGLMWQMYRDIKENLLQVVNNAKNNTQVRNGDIKEWGEEFSKLLNNAIDISECISRIRSNEDLKGNELGVFCEEVLKKIDLNITDLQRKVSQVTVIGLSNCKPTALSILKEQLGGCWSCCPFCNTVCTNTIEGHDGSHSAPFHRPEGLTGTAWETNKKLSSDICSSAVSSNYRFVAFLSDGKWYQYKNYKSAGAPYSQWSITPDTSMQDYWKWVTCHFQHEWEKEYLTKFSDIPEEWKNVQKKKILKDLKKNL